MPVTVTNRTAVPARGAPGDIDTLFVPANLASGLPTNKAVSCRSITDYEAAGGTRGLNATVYDGLDNYFREGGRQAYVGRYTTASTITAALALFTEDLGGGQIVGWDMAVGAVTFGILQDWAAANKRFALLDAAVTDDTVAELTTLAGLLPVSNADYGLLCGPWVTIPAPAGVIGGATRQAPASSTVAALIARADALGNPNRAPAGRDFSLRYATGTVIPVMSDTEATTLRNLGCNPIRSKFGLLVLDGFQTSIDQSPDTPFWQGNCCRARMWLQWRAIGVGLNYEYKPIDGRGRILRALQTDLDAECLALYAVDGLYGDTPEDAFATTVNVSINTESTIAQGELHAVTEARFSLHAKSVIIELVSVPVTGRVSSAA